MEQGFCGLPPARAPGISTSKRFFLAHMLLKQSHGQCHGPGISWFEHTHTAPGLWQVHPIAFSCAFTVLFMLTDAAVPEHAGKKVERHG